MTKPTKIYENAEYGQYKNTKRKNFTTARSLSLNIVILLAF